MANKFDKVEAWGKLNESLKEKGLGVSDWKRSTRNDAWVEYFKNYGHYISLLLSVSENHDYLVKDRLKIDPRKRHTQILHTPFILLAFNSKRNDFQNKEKFPAVDIALRKIFEKQYGSELKKTWKQAVKDLDNELIDDMAAGDTATGDCVFYILLLLNLLKKHELIDEKKLELIRGSDGNEPHYAFSIKIDEQQR